MLSYVLAATVVLVAFFVPWWVFVRETKIVLPLALIDTVETEGFQAWLHEEAWWMIWGRDEEGRYYAFTFGSIAARRIRRKAFELHEW